MPFPAERLISWSTTFPRGQWHRPALLAAMGNIWASSRRLQDRPPTSPACVPKNAKPRAFPTSDPGGGSTCQSVPCPLQVTGRGQDCQCHGQRKAWIARAWETPGLRGLRQDCWGRPSFPNSVSRGAKPLRHRFTAFFHAAIPAKQ